MTCIVRTTSSIRPFIRDLCILPKILLQHRVTLLRKIIIHKALCLSRGALAAFENRPITAVNHAIFTKKLPERVEQIDIKIGICGRRNDLTAQIHQARHLAKNIGLFRGFLHKLQTLGRDGIPICRNIAAVIDYNAKIGQTTRDFDNRFIDPRIEFEIVFDDTDQILQPRFNGLDPAVATPVALGGKVDDGAGIGEGTGL